MLTYDFTGKVALITGGTSGIGLATARAFARAGAHVVIASRNAPAAAEPALVFIAADVRDDASVAALVGQTVERVGRIDIAFNAAGVGGDMAPIATASQDVWDDVMAVNARGVWLAMRHEIAAMRATGGGTIINMSSIYGAAGKAAHHAYVASKHAVIGMTRSVALEVAADGIRVNALCAGVTATPAMRRAAEVVPQVVADLVAQHPIGRMATEDEIAAAVMWLASPGAGYVTGTALAVDGGFLAA